MKKVLLKDGRELLIRKVNSEDAKDMIDYLNIICGESDYLTFGPNELNITLEKEEQILKRISTSQSSIMVVGLLNGVIAGSLNFSGQERIRLRHAGEFGISVRKDFYNLGIGNALMEFLIEWAKESKKIRKINLRVRSDNTKAINLYKKYGFTVEGTLRRDFYINGKFYDSLLMGLLID